MKKFLLLVSALAYFASANAQIDTIYRETFEPPDSVSSTTLGSPSVTTLWNDTSSLYISSPNSYHGKVVAPTTGNTNSQIVFRTDSFSTVGYSYVFLQFYHIAKINQINSGIIRISTDGGTTWTNLSPQNCNYLGTSTWAGAQGGSFNEAVYNIPNQGINYWFSGTDPAPQQSWWQFEAFDISSLALGSSGNGVSDVRIEFSANFVLSPPQITGRPFGAGWFVDNLQIIASNCEIFPPRIRMNYRPNPCYPVPVEGNITENPSNSYTIGAQVTDSVPTGTNANNYSGIDSVTVFYRVIDTSGVGAWQTKNLTLAVTNTSEYRTTINNILVGDTVEYYIKAWDLSCPNSTRMPDSLANPAKPYYVFYPVSGLPQKCGSPDCGAEPGTIDQFPWLEDFESSAWAPGTGSGDNGTMHRGLFPNQQTGDAYWQVAPNPNTAGFAWSVRTGGTHTMFTGPTGNHTPGGARYVYAESSQGQRASSTSLPPVSQLITPCIDLTQTNKCMGFEFYYHMFGEDMGNLRVDIDTGSNTTAWNLAAVVNVGEQQDQQADPWKRAVISLEPYLGTYVRLRFVASKQTTKTGTDIRGDIAIDDLRIFELPPVDMEVLEVSDPKPGLCAYSSNQDVNVVLRNTGCDTITSTQLQYRLYTNGTAGSTFTRNVTGLSLATGDTTTYTITNSGLNLSNNSNNYQIEVWVNQTNDTVSSNDDAISDTLSGSGAFTNFPLVLDFEGLTPGSHQTGNAVFFTRTGFDPNYEFTVGERFTFTRNTGPKGGYGQRGQYLYTEASGSSGNVDTYLESDCMDFTGLTNPTLDFYYHMWGTDITGIEVQLNEPAVMGPDNWITLPGSFTAPSTALQNDPLSDFQFKRVNLSSYSGKQVKLRIVAKRKIGGDLADIAIDNVMIYDRIANDAGAELLFKIRPNTGSPWDDILSVDADTTVTIYPPNLFRANVFMRNFGTSNIVNPTFTVTVEPLCGPNAGQITTYTSSAINTTINPGNGAMLVDNNLQVVIPTGRCEICAYGNVTGDNISFNDTACRYITGLPNEQIDFFADYENCSFDEYGFFAQGGYLQWEFGRPLPTSGFASVQSRGNIWGTNLADGYYLDGLEERLRTPLLFIPDSIVKPTIRFWQYVDMGQNAAGKVEFNRGGWSTLGATLGSFQGVGTNWYTNSPMGTLSSNVPGIEQGFTGSSGGWRYSTYPMLDLNREGNFVPFRFTFKSTANANASRQSDGWAIDDFEVIIPPQHSASPDTFRFVNPLQIPTNDQPFDVIIRNTGAQLLDTCEVFAEILPVGGGPAIWQSSQWYTVDLPAFFIEGSTFKYRFPEDWDQGVTSGQHLLRIVTRRPNVRPKDDRPIDDTLEVVVTVLPEFFYNSSQNDTLYCNDFEPTTQSLPFLPLNSKTFSGVPSSYSWRKGDPTQFGGAASGNSAWATNLTGNYGVREQSALISPVFVIEPDTSYELSFMHNFDTEQFHDGGNIELSLDGGLTWTVLGFANEQNWYNTEFVTSLDIIKPGWTNVSNGWDSASYVFRFDTAADRVVIRYRFESDYAIQSKGWAVDNFCLKMSSKPHQFVVGDEEFNPSPNSFVGTLSPNPTSDVTNLPIFVAQAKSIHVNVVNVIGQEVYNSKYNLDKGSNQLQFETFNWNAGVYFINLTIDGQHLTRKLVVQ